MRKPTAPISSPSPTGSYEYFLQKSKTSKFESGHGSVQMAEQRMK